MLKGLHALALLARSIFLLGLVTGTIASALKAKCDADECPTDGPKAGRLMIQKRTTSPVTKSNAFERELNIVSSAPDAQTKAKANQWRAAAQAYEDRAFHKQIIVFVGGAARTMTSFMTYFFGLHPEVSTMGSSTFIQDTQQDDKIVMPGTTFMGSYKAYDECNYLGALVQDETKKDDAMTEGIFAALMDSGFDLSKPVLVHKYLEHAWHMRLLQSVLKETHDVRFLVTVKHPFDIKPEAFGCDPNGFKRARVAGNLDKCFDALVNTVLPHVNHYFVLRVEDLFSQTQIVRDVEDAFGLTTRVKLPLKGAMLYQDVAESSDGRALGDHCKTCNPEQFGLDYKFFGMCEDVFVHSDKRRVPWNVFPKFGYTLASLRNLSGPAMSMRKGKCNSR